MLFSGLVMLVVGLRVLTFSGAGLKIIAREDMREALYAQEQAYEYLQEANKGLRPLVIAHPEAASITRTAQVDAKYWWPGPDMTECPRQNHLVMINLVQDAYDALQQCGIKISPAVIHDMNTYNSWVERYETITEKYNLSGWTRTPLMFRLSLTGWQHPLGMEG